METYSCVFLGEKKVGKSTLIYRYVNKVFPQVAEPTIGIDFFSVNVGDIHLQIWDSSGGLTGLHRTASHLIESDAICLFYDICKTGTFDIIESWYQEIKSIITRPKLLILVGNKSDPGAREKVYYEMGFVKAMNLQCYFIQTTAKVQDATDQFFFHLAQKLKIRANCLYPRGWSGTFIN